MNRRLQNAGLAVLLVAVAGLVASAVLGVVGRSAPPVPAGAPSAAVAEPPAGRVRVEVLNASGRPRLARDVMRYLRERGFDVVQAGNARPEDGTATRVLVRGGNARAAREVADSLGIAAVASAPDPTAFLDASVVLGAGWRIPGPDTASAQSPARGTAAVPAQAPDTARKPAAPGSPAP